MESRSEVEEDEDERRRRSVVLVVVAAAGAAAEDEQQRTLRAILVFLDEEAKAFEAKFSKYGEEALNAITRVG